MQELYFKPQPVEEVILPAISGDVSNLSIDLVINSLNPDRHWLGVLGYFDVIIDENSSYAMKIRRKVSSQFAEFDESIFISPKNETEDKHHMNVQLLSSMSLSEMFFSGLKIPYPDAVIEFNIKTKTTEGGFPQNYPGMNPSKFIDWGLNFFDTRLKRKVNYIRDKWKSGSDTYAKFVKYLEKGLKVEEAIEKVGSTRKYRSLGFSSVVKAEIVEADEYNPRHVLVLYGRNESK